DELALQQAPSFLMEQASANLSSTMTGRSSNSSCASNPPPPPMPAAQPVQQEPELPKTAPSVNRPPEKRQRVPSAYNRDEIQRIKAGNPDITHREAFSAAAKNHGHSDSLCLVLAACAWVWSVASSSWALSHTSTSASCRTRASRRPSRL
ncbi:hypothetical protein ACJX0J_042483, partial [Zea mays]